MNISTPGQDSPLVVEVTDALAEYDEHLAAERFAQQLNAFKQHADVAAEAEQMLRSIDEQLSVVESSSDYREADRVFLAMQRGGTLGRDRILEARDLEFQRMPLPLQSAEDQPRRSGATVDAGTTHRPELA